MTRVQLEVLRLRMTGLTQEEVANNLGTTRQNISLVERRAHRNLEKAEETIAAYSARDEDIEAGAHRHLERRRSIHRTLGTFALNEKLERKLPL